MSGTWSPEQYARFAAERARPFQDLLARLPREGVRRAADLGCGSGEHTRALALRWPGVAMVGIDTSDAMLARARELEPVAGLSFERGDIATWEPPAALDFVGAFASLQWLPDHEALLARTASWLAPGGTLAVQMPRNHDEPSHRAIAETVAAGPWRDDLAGALRDGQDVRVPRPLPAILASAALGHPVHRRPGWPRAADRPVAAPGAYQAILARLGLEPDVWETTYWHLLAGDDPVLEWVKGTALTPLLPRLASHAERAAFLAALAARLRAAYPRGPHGTPFPFRRLFFVGKKPGAR